jgi:two-component system sensor histidine kinase KdpD
VTGERIDPGRPTGEEMLARIRTEPGAGRRGGLRVYVGMAPGVGKTYTMLEEAHRRRDRGTDVVVGFVETHGRQHTADLIEGLEVVPRRQLEYRGVIVEEMDSDAVIARHPQVALVDELAHTNAPGSPREKRWADVELIRDAGISVISTLNVQHLESVAEAVETITGAPVHERLPDEVLAKATEIELIDMSPRALRQRMKHGNVYPPERVGIALDRFFTDANLTALREIALRVVARHVDVELDVASRLPSLAGATERVIVLVDDSHAARRAIRRAAEIAAALQGRLVAVSVETAPSGAAPSDAQRRLRENLDDAADLGAEVVRVAAQDVAGGLAQVARERRATHVVVPYRPPGRFAWLRARPLADQLLERLGDTELHLVADAPASTHD